MDDLTTNLTTDERDEGSGGYPGPLAGEVPFATTTLAIEELRAAYQSIPAGTPSVEDVLTKLPRLYAAIEGVLGDNPCKELGKAYVECQRLLIEARADR